MSHLGLTLNERPVCQHLLVDVKDPTVSFATSGRAIAGTMAKFQIPTLTSRGHCINGTAAPSANDATPQICAAYVEEEVTMPFSQN